VCFFEKFIDIEARLLSEEQFRRQRAIERDASRKVAARARFDLTFLAKDSPTRKNTLRSAG
jgi:hypothetical protein